MYLVPTIIFYIDCLLFTLLETKINLERSKNLEERDKSEELLKNILPPTIVEELKCGNTLRLQKYSEVSVILIDMVFNASDFNRTGRIYGQDV